MNDWYDLFVIGLAAFGAALMGWFIVWLDERSEK